MFGKKPRFFVAFFVVIALSAISFLAARDASFAAQNGARLGFLAAIVVAAMAFSWTGALLSALIDSALSAFAMQNALRGASTRAPFLSALLLDVALFFGVGIVVAALFGKRRGLEEMAFRDQASGLLLWPRLLERLGEEVRRALSDASPLALLLIESDDATSRNHDDATAARASTRALADLITQCARAEDIAGVGPPRHVARFAAAGKTAGASCFAVVLPRAAQSGAQALAERIVAAAQQRARVTGARHALSCGIALMSARVSQKTPDAATLVEHAEEALAEAQRTGIGRIVIFDDEMRAG